MDRKTILRDLARARERVAQVERNLKVQQQIVDVLQGDGCNTLHARKLLQQYQELQARHIADLGLVFKVWILQDAEIAG
jgi:hypothetical protein